MTRENKLALVVGFGLILLVGILISDHFSKARHEPAAELTHAVDPLNEDRWEEPDLITMREPQPQRGEFTPAAPRERNRYEPEDTNLDGDVVAIDPMRGGSTSFEMGGQTRRDDPPSRPATSAPTVRTHDVRSGESLTSICQRYYGDPTLIDDLARYNNLRNPDALSLGLRLRIPDASVLGGTAPSRASIDQPERAPAPQYATYTVREGDSLSTIARSLLGSSRRYLEIYELNRDVLASPDRVREGMVLKVPSTR
jgi:nucleoid-associated protein YgaU